MSDVTATPPENTVIGAARDWEDMMALKKINATDISHGIFREMWTPNTKYDTYRHDWNTNRSSVYNGNNPYVKTPNDLSEAKYYVINSNYRVYICLKQRIFNGNVMPSTDDPETGVAVGSNTGILKTGDGYYWKFVGVTTPADVVKFMTDLYHPVRTLTSAPGAMDYSYPQWTNQQSSKNFKQGIYAINVTSSGTGYNGGVAGTVSFPSGSIAVRGNGSGLAGTVTFGSGGSVIDIEVTNPGSGYTHANIVISGGNGFVPDIIYSPSWGLGADPVYDLCAFNLIVNTKLDSAEGNGDFTIANDYRKICLIANPTDYNTTTLSTSTTMDATTTLVLTNGGGDSAYLPDTVVTCSSTGAVGRVVDWNSNTGKLRIIRTSNENYNIVGANALFAAGGTVTPGSGVISGVTTPEVQAGSGQILYVENRRPITRALNQTESLTIVVEM